MNVRRFTAQLVLMFLLAGSLAAQIANLVQDSDAVGIVPSFGGGPNDLQIGLAMRLERLDGRNVVGTYVTLKNFGTNVVSLFRGGPAGFVLEGSNSFGKPASLVRSTDSMIRINRSFLLEPPYSLKPGSSATLKADLAHSLRAPEEGRYFFSTTVRMKISRESPPTVSSVESIELMSGPVEFVIPSYLVSTNMKGNADSASFVPQEPFFKDTSNAKSPDELAWMRRANESMTNLLRQHYPHLLGEAPLKTNDTNLTNATPVSVPIAEGEAIGGESSRGWIGGVVVAAAVAVGLGFVRRARNRPRN